MILFNKSLNVELIDARARALAEAELAKAEYTAEYKYWAAAKAEWALAQAEYKAWTKAEYKTLAKAEYWAAKAKKIQAKIEALEGQDNDII